MTADADSLSIYVETNETGTGPGSPSTSTTSSCATARRLRSSRCRPLKDELADYFLFGGAVDPASQVTSPRHAELMQRHLNSITCGNAMKWDADPPRGGELRLHERRHDRQLRTANGMTMRGHTLVWHSQNPAWLFKDAAGNDLLPTPENKELMLQRLEDHIRTVVARYNDVVSSWDVVNEVIDPSQPDGLRRTQVVRAHRPRLHRPRLPGRARGRGAGRQALHQRLQHHRPAQARRPARTWSRA